MSSSKEAYQKALSVLADAIHCASEKDGEKIDTSFVHPRSAYAQGVRDLLNHGEVLREEVGRAFTDTDFISPDY